ncbi:MAG TPA: hypothetical protein VGP53_04380, partial [Acidimicrobiales bacterium]|nr:hypothetical protein [Acidimicrobiales bacterium]
MPGALGWSIGVLLLGSLMGVVVMPSAQGRSDDEEDTAGLAAAGLGSTSAEPGAAPGPEAAPTTVAVAAPTTGATPAST